jgi:hypothetical protein
MWTAFGLTAVSGTALLIADASTRLVSPVFYVKMVFVGLAVATLELIKRQAFATPAAHNAPAGNVKALALASIFFWLAAITAGRLMAYLGPAAGFVE